MKDKKVVKIDFSRERIASQADKLYNEGKFVAALRLAHRELEEFGGDGDVYTRLSDIYEGMGLHASALNWWFRFLDEAEEADLPDIYEGIAVNFLNLGNETQSAFYYNKLIDVDDTLPEEAKWDIADAFSVDKKSRFRFVYPPQLADYSNELSVGSKALKSGDCKRAIAELDKIVKGSKDYAAAKEMQAVAYLLAGDAKNAELACTELLETQPDDVRAQATLAAVYLEQGREEESLALAKRLASEKQTETDDIYKVATVCCENGLHEEAYRKFCLLDEKIPYDGRMLYFKGVSAYKCGKIEEAERALDMLCAIYPDAEVAKYYLRAIRNYRAGNAPAPELIYFYHLPQEEREARCRALLQIGKASKDEAQLFGLFAMRDKYFEWCFDEMDGGDHDLQYLALVTAVHVRADEFIRDTLLDHEVADVLKVETLRLLMERNEDDEFGLVLCNIYRRVPLMRIAVGRKKRKRFVEAYAKIASKFSVVSDNYAIKLKESAEKLYSALEEYGGLDLIDNTDDCACAIFLLSGLKDLGGNADSIAAAFGANPQKVNVLVTMSLSKQHGLDKNGQQKTEETTE